MSSTPLSQQITLCPSCPKTSKYSDFAKSANDFFSRDFPSGVVRVETRTQSRNLLSGRIGKSEAFSDEFKVIATKDLTSGVISAEVKNTTNFLLPKTKIEAKSTTSLTSSNLLCQQLTLTNAVVEGLKLEFNGSLQPNGGVSACRANNAKANVEFTHGCFLLGTSFDVLRGPVMGADFATKFRDFQVGGDIGYDISKGAIDKYSVSVAFDRLREKAVLQAHTGFKSFTASYFQKFNDQMEVAYRASWSAKIPNVSMEVGAKWNLIGGGFIKAKLDNVGRLGLALASDLRPGVQVTLGATIDTAKLNENSHKLGVELVYSA